MTKNNHFNVRKELELLKQTNPPAATAFEKLIKSYDKSLADIEGNYGSRITLIHSEATQAIDKTKALEKELSKLKGFSDKSQDAEKLLKHLQKKTNEFKVIESKANLTNQKLMSLQVNFDEFKITYEAFKQIITSILDLVETQGQVLRTMTSQVLTYYPESIVNEIIGDAKARREMDDFDQSRALNQFLNQLRTKLAKGIPND